MTVGCDTATGPQLDEIAALVGVSRDEPWDPDHVRRATDWGPAVERMIIASRLYSGRRALAPAMLYSVALARRIRTSQILGGGVVRTDYPAVNSRDRRRYRRAFRQALAIAIDLATEGRRADALRAMCTVIPLCAAVRVTDLEGHRAEAERAARIAAETPTQRASRWFTEPLQPADQSLSRRCGHAVHLACACYYNRPDPAWHTVADTTHVAVVGSRA